MVTKEQIKKISKIAKRAKACGLDPNREFINLMMDLEAAYDDVGLDLDGLLKANIGDFIHDLCGIMKNMNRETGKLENFFLPRYAIRGN